MRDRAPREGPSTGAAEGSPLDRERRYRALLENFPDFIAIVDRSRRFLFANRLSPGLTEEGLLTQRVDDYVIESARPTMIATVERCFATGEPGTYEAPGILPSGEHRSFSVRVVPLRTASGEEEAMLIVTDTTLAEQAASSLQHSEEQLDRATQAAGVALWEWWPSDDRMHLDRTWSSLLGLGDDPATGTRAAWEEHIVADDLAKVRASLEAHVTGQTPSIEIEYGVRSARGEVRHILTRGRAVEQDQTGRALRVVGTHLDITARRRTEQEHAALQSQLAHAQRMELIGQLAGGVAHDFNNLLVAISGHAELALHNSHDPSKVESSLETILTASARATDLTRRLLAVARRQPIELRTLELGALLQETIRLLERTLPESLRIELTGDGGPWWVAGDAVQLQQVFMNLAINARDAMPDGGRLTFHLSRRWGPDGSARLRIAVRDTGAGIPEDQREKVFEPFFTTKAAGFGTGLGLAVVAGTVQKHGGDISLESGPQGTVFFVDLPSSQPRKVTPPELDHHLFYSGRAVILLAEDDRMVRDLTGRILSSAGYEVLTARDGKSAKLEIDRQHQRLSLVILDAVMPEGDGNDVYKYLRAVCPNVPVLFTSGYGAGALPTAEGSPPVSVLLKPYSVSKLLSRIAELLDPTALHPRAHSA